MGQVLLKGEDQKKADQAMRRRMELTLALFAENGDRNLVLGAYGCGVFIRAFEAEFNGISQ